MKEKYKDLKACYYYDQDKQKLSVQGVTPVESFIYAGKEYFSCVASHLTPFTAGTVEVKDEDEGNNGGVSLVTIIFIVIGVILLLALLAVVIISIRRKSGKRASESIDGAFNKEEGLVDMN